MHQIIIPLHIHANHWICASIHFSLRRIAVYDSIESTYRTNQQRQFEHQEYYRLTLVYTLSLFFLKKSTLTLIFFRL